MSVNILIVLRILMIAVFLALSFFVYLKDRKSLLNKAYSLVIFTGFIWSFTVLMADIDLDRALLWTQLSLLGPIFIPPSFLIFSIIFPYKSVLLSRVKIILFFIPSLILTLFIFSKFNVERVWFEKWGTDYKPGILYIFVLLLFAIYISYSVALFLKKYRVLKGLERLQILYVLLAIISAVITGFVFNLILPLFVSGQSSTYGPSLSSFIFFAFTTYAILRYRLMDIRVIIKRSAVFTVLVLFITALYAVIAYLLSVVFIGIGSTILNGVVMAILVALGFEPLKKGLSEITDSFLFKAEYKPQEVLGEFADKLSSTLNLNELTQFLVKKTSEVFKCTKSSLYLFNEEHKEYQEVAFSGKRSPIQIVKIDKKLFAKIFSYLKQIGKAKDVIVREEIKKINEQAKSQILDLVIKLLDQHEVNLVVPFYVEEELIGILFLGDKKSGDVYSQQDLNVLEIIAGQSAVSIQNAGLFEEQKHFAEHLKKEVERATKELQVANVQLKKLDKAKSEFISIASHQLRTPLTVIKGYISMISQGDFGKMPVTIIKPMERVFQSTNRIIGLINDLLDISRIESGRMEYEFAKNDLTKIIEDVVGELEQHAKNKGLQFEYFGTKEKIPQIMLDEKRVREVVMNLIDNAIKYTEQGFVKVELKKLDNTVRFCVSDSGRGIDSDEMPMLFQKFSRAKGAQLMHTEGTGLGLYIAKQIIEKHGGKIWAESEGRGKGSKFCIDFKIKNKRLEK
jgi:signal transduction histidine kinase